MNNAALQATWMIRAIFAINILLFALQGQSSAAATKEILVLHSYHQGLVWTDEMMEGIYSVFNKHGADTEIHVEYMDTKRYFDGLTGKYLTRLRDMYKDKYGGMKLDMIISSDDDAFQFLLMYHDELFAGTPIVFCGVNHFEDAMLSGHDHITGVMEFLDTKASIDIALKLHPETDELVIINDTTISGKANRQILEQLADDYKGKAEFVFIDKDYTGLTLQELLARLRLLKKGSVVFYSDFLRNRDEYIIQEIAVPEISRTCKRPIYTHYDEIMGLGVVGGKLIDGKSHGRKAAQMALQILQGTQVSKLPVYKESTGSYIFDYQQLQRFNIDENALPEGSIIINKPFSFYSQYKHLVWAVSGVFAFLVISLIAISLNVRKRQKAEAELENAYAILEQKVEERTKDLNRANLHLQKVIAARISIENALIDSVRSYRTLAENLPGIVFRVFTRENNRIHFFNKVSESLTGYKDHELSGGDLCSIESCMHPEDRVTVVGEIKAAIAAQRPFSVEYRFKHKDGSLRYFIEKGMPIHDSDGKLLHIDGIILDITERKRAEQALRESEERHRTILRTAMDGFWLVEPQGRLLEVNEAYCRMSGYSAPELLSMSIADLEAVESADAAVAHNQKIMAQGEDRFESRHRRKDGSVFDVEVSTKYWPEAGQFIGFLRDITERKRTEKEIKRALKEKEVLLREIHHRVKNNMQVVYSLLNLQAKGIADKTVRAMFEESRNRVRSMALIHEKLYGAEDLAYIDFNAYLQRLVKDIAGTYQRQDVVLSVARESIALDVNAGIPCGLIVNELVTNSLKYAFPEGRKGTIEVGIAKSSDGDFVLTVADNGIGFPPEKDFRRISSLGLQLVIMLTGQIHGTIELARAEGTTFRITFPGQAEALEKQVL